MSGSNPRCGCEERSGIHVKKCEDSPFSIILHRIVPALAVTTDLVIPARELRWKAVRSSGPGGQNVNKVATKVELRFLLNESLTLSDSVKARLRRQVAGNLDSEGRVVITCQTARSQRQNLEQAQAMLVAAIQRALIVPRSRRKTKPTSSSRVARLHDKRHTAEKKQARRRSAED